MARHVRDVTCYCDELQDSSKAELGEKAADIASNFLQRCVISYEMMMKMSVSAVVGSLKPDCLQCAR